LLFQKDPFVQAESPEDLSEAHDAWIIQSLGDKISEIIRSLYQLTEPFGIEDHGAKLLYLNCDPTIDRNCVPRRYMVMIPHKVFHGWHHV